MFSRKDLEPLLRYPTQPESPVLSLYLDVDQSRQANRGRGILVAARALLAGIRDESVPGRGPDHLDEDSRRAETFLEGYEPSGKSLVLFCDASAGLLWHRTLPVPLPAEARHRPAPYLRPLLETLDERERYGIALVDRQQARFFTVFLGEIEEEREAFAPLDVRSTRTTGTDHLFSENRFRRRADEHAHLHLKRVATLLREVQRDPGFDRLVLAGSVEATSELHRLLPRVLAERLAATWKMPIEAREADLLRMTTDLEERRESEREMLLVEELLETARGGRQAVLGIDAALDALRQGRALRLVYVVDGPVAGGLCPACGTLLRKAEGPCDFCGSELQRVRDLVGRMAGAVADSGGRLDRLHGPAADRLRSAGGVGAFLRF
jgi:peptide subunit release factor 1 (eRF1)